MITPRTHSIEELEKLTGFNQRTIAYYIQQGLLPRVGRRGRSTRYPQLFADRLKFINRVRELQDAGRLGSVTLPKIAAVTWYLVDRGRSSPDLAELPDEEIERLFADPDIDEHRNLGKTADGQPVTANFGKFGPYVRAGEATASISGEDFFKITLVQALELIGDQEDEKQSRVIKGFEGSKIRVLNGRFGPYVTDGRTNAKIPKAKDPTQLTLLDCEQLLGNRRLKELKRSASQRKDVLLERASADRLPESSGRMDVSSRDLTGQESIAAVFERREMASSPRIAASFNPDADWPRAQRVRSGSSDVFSSASYSMSPSPEHEDVLDLAGLKKVIQELEDKRSARRDNTAARSEKLWTRVPVLEDLELSVRGIGSDDERLLEELADRLRRILQRR